MSKQEPADAADARHALAAARDAKQALAAVAAAVDARRKAKAALRNSNKAALTALESGTLAAHEEAAVKAEIARRFLDHAATATKVAEHAVDLIDAPPSGTKPPEASPPRCPACRCPALFEHWDLLWRIRWVECHQCGWQSSHTSSEAARPILPPPKSEAPEGDTPAASKGKPDTAAELTPAARAVAAAYDLQREGKRVSLIAACKRAKVDRGHLREKYPEAVQAISKIATPDRTPKRGIRDRRTRNIDALDDSEE
jgi:hypothetical protein